MMSVYEKVGLWLCIYCIVSLFGGRELSDTKATITFALMCAGYILFIWGDKLKGGGR